jgi:N-acetylneuraminic acid mutarotase
LNKENGDTALLSPALGELPYSIGYPACVSTDTGIVVAGGENETGPLSTVELIHIDKSQLEPQLKITSLPSLPVACSGAMITAMGSKVYLAGGNNANGHTLGQFLLLDLTDTAKGWQPLPELVQPTSFGVLYADQPSHTIYLAGGRKSNVQARTTFYASLFAFNTENQNWEEKANLPYSVSAATGITMQGKLLFFGGDQGETFHQTEDLLLKIAVAKDSTEKRQLTLQKNTLQQHHPGFTRQILAYNPALDQWKPAGKLSFAAQVTTTAIAWQKGVIIPCGEIRAGIRYANIIEGAINPTP